MRTKGHAERRQSSLQATIYSLPGRGWSQRRIAHELGINRETVGRYLRLAKSAILGGLQANDFASINTGPALRHLSPAETPFTGALKILDEDMEQYILEYRR